MNKARKGPKEWIISWNDQFVWMLRKPFEREREREGGIKEEK